MLITELFTRIHAVNIPYEYSQEKDGTYSIWTQPNNESVINSWGAGATLDDAENDLIDGLKEIARSYYDDCGTNGGISEKIAPCILKLLICTDKEIKQCLIGKTCENI